MLRYVHIRNIAVIDDLEVEFGSGLNVITGETGSGKSIIIDSVGLLTGVRASPSIIRTGETRAAAEGIFTVPGSSQNWKLLQDQGIEPAEEENELIVRREISASGSGRVLVNGVLTTAAFLRPLGQNLVEIHGQHDTKLILQPRCHLELLDSFHDRRDLLDSVATLAAGISADQKELDRLTEAEQGRLQRLDLLEFQIRDIGEAGILPGEENRLQAERTILVNSEKLFQVSRDGYETLYESGESVVHNVGRLKQSLAELTRLDPRLGEVVESLGNSLYQLEDVAYWLRNYQSSVEYNEARLNEIEIRLAQLDRLKRKYGPTLEAVQDHYQKILDERDTLVKSEETRTAIRARLEELHGQYRLRATELSAIRKAAAGGVEREMVAHLDDLAMSGTRFQVGENATASAGSFPRWGWDQVEFLVSPNVGEELRPLHKIASGGELSRLTLALKLVLQSDPDATLIFDEVDAGIGGGVASMVGRKLKRVASRNQVFCVTHVPQIAAFADHHYRVEKRITDGRTYTRIQHLTGDERVEELARMLGGVTVTEAARQHARQLLETG